MIAAISFTSVEIDKKILLIPDGNFTGSHMTSLIHGLLDDKGGKGE